MENIDIVSLLVETVPAIALLIWIIQKQDRRMEAITTELKNLTEIMNQVVLQMALIDSRLGKKKDD